MSENNQTKPNGRGGKRQGSGRKKGAATQRTREIADQAAQDGITPLEFMLKVMRTEPDETVKDQRLLQSILEMRFEAAKAAAPYMHPRLAAVEHSGPNGGAIQTDNVWRVELVRPNANPDPS